MSKALLCVLAIVGLSLVGCASDPEPTDLEAADEEAQTRVEDEEATDDTEAPPDTEPAEDEVGTTANPAPLGQGFTFGEDGEWSAGVMEWREATPADFDAEMLSYSSAPEVPAGHKRMILVYEATYSGDELTTSEPFIVGVVGSQVWDQGITIGDASVGTCTYALLAENPYEVTSGQTIQKVSCWDLPTDEAGEVLITLTNAFSFTDAEIVYDPAA